MFKKIAITPESKDRLFVNYTALGCWSVVVFWVRAHFGQSNFPFFQLKRKQEILLIVVIQTLKYRQK